MRKYRNNLNRSRDRFNRMYYMNTTEDPFYTNIQTQLDELNYQYQYNSSMLTEILDRINNSKLNQNDLDHIKKDVKLLIKTIDEQYKHILEIYNTFGFAQNHNIATLTNKAKFNTQFSIENRRLLQILRNYVGYILDTKNKNVRERFTNELFQSDDRFKNFLDQNSNMLPPGTFKEKKPYATLQY